MENESSPVVSSGTETSAVADTSSTTSTQTEDTTVASTESTTEQTAQERKDYRRLQKEDADLNSHVQKEIARARARWEKQQLKATAKTAVDQGDTVTALSLAQRIASEPDEVDEDDSTGHSVQWQQKANKVQPHLERLLRIDDNGQATNPYYVKLFEKVGQKDLDARYAKDPGGFVDWLDDQLTDLRVDDMLRKKAPSLYEAGKLDGQNSALAGAPKPLNGTAAGGGKRWTPESAGKLSPAEYRANRESILRDLYAD